MEKVNLNAVTVVGVAERKVKMKKVVSAICSAALAMSVVAVSAFAEGTSGVDYTSLIDSLKTGFSEIVTNCIAVAGAVLPIGLGLLGLGKIWDVAKRFFTKTTSG